MTSISDVRKYLKRLVESDASASEGEKDLVNSFLGDLARLDDKSLSEFSAMLLSFMGRKSTASKKTGAGTADKAARAVQLEAEFLARLKRSFGDDRAFANDLAALDECSEIGREALNRLFNTLFGRDRGLPSKATRAKLIRDISDERVLSVRSEKAAGVLLGRRPVSAS